MPASYPTSSKAFTTKTNGPAQTIDASHVNDLQLEVTAIETDLIAGLPAARGGTGLTAPGTAGNVLTSNGSAWTAAAGITEQTTALTGAQVNFDLTASLTYLRCTGAAPAFSGFTVAGAAPAAGARVILDCLGTTSAQVTHQGVGSTAANRVICVSTNGQIVGVSGRILCVYDGTTSRWRATVIDAGAPISVAFAAGNFTASGTMTWTVAAGDQVTFTYQQHGKMLAVTIRVITSTVGGVLGAILKVLVPGGFTITKSVTVPVVVSDAGGATVGQLVLSAATTSLDCYLITGGNWSASTDATNVQAVVTFEVD